MQSPATRRSTSHAWARASAAIAIASLLGSAYYIWAARRKPSSGGAGGSVEGVGERFVRGAAEALAASAAVAKKTWKGQRVMTISMKNIVVWNPSPDPTTPIYAFRESALPFLTSLVSNPRNQIHLIMVVTSDEEEAQVRSLLLSSNLYNLGLDPRRVVFCSTEEGKGHIVRHIEPSVHVESNDDVITKLAPFVQRIVRVKKKVVAASDSEASSPPQSHLFNTAKSGHNRFPSLSTSPGKPTWPILSGGASLSGRTSSAPGGLTSASASGLRHTPLLPTPSTNGITGTSPLASHAIPTPAGSAPMSRRPSSAGVVLSRTPTLTFDLNSVCSAEHLPLSSEATDLFHMHPSRHHNSQSHSHGDMIHLPAVSDTEDEADLFDAKVEAAALAAAVIGERFPNVEFVESLGACGLAAEV
ncbi:uncharacterized protein EV422DRAFT_69684 [Fimicolochytrium jonesii]|uniref:uncharacterized protein n=1 Tax=Fimicolochytrium jonesii TaxID=1396493 RepID=UPI0022FDDD09|nr:uncharacterized protein EV422DRAFT_69684 [Fimicolochytrium jonesii]KAI8820418.1 hypothetical protein EV422DRAFT_69684 [Fimicolochytrium jonesii]